MTLRPYIPLTQHRGHVLVTGPAVEPVTASVLRDYLAETVSGMPDSVANDLIAEARELLENITGLALITQTWRLTLDHWPGPNDPWWDGVRQIAISELAGQPAHVQMPRYPLQDVDDVMVYGLDGTGQAVDIGATFDIDTQSQRGRMVLKFGAVWPIAMRRSNAIEIEYTSGFGDTSADVPNPLKRAVKQMAAYLYSHRGDDCAPEDVISGAGVNSILAGYRAVRL